MSVILLCFFLYCQYCSFISEILAFLLVEKTDRFFCPLVGVELVGVRDAGGGVLMEVWGSGGKVGFCGAKGFGCRFGVCVEAWGFK